MCKLSWYQTLKVLRLPKTIHYAHITRKWASQIYVTYVLWFNVRVSADVSVSFIVGDLSGNPEIYKEISLLFLRQFDSYE